MEKISFEGLFINFPKTGNCEVNIQALIKVWDSDKNFCINKNLNDEYRIYSKKGKATISEKQALEIIKLLALKPIKSSIFKNSLSYKKEKQWAKQLQKMKLQLQKAQEEVKMLSREIGHLTQNL